ncbi:hypothetical protein IEQ34_013762 [Dendrobium chrysotoxum]|uniref:Uncharacterized protein n=1 Tax=Dendrobium chrysotoxum TaxID=161865 RepID=A0AAV7GS77_DENCH|nr:hypothetical protein IEQ34_013762 [Dendrobium chrysotoxum]
MPRSTSKEDDPLFYCKEEDTVTSTLAVDEKYYSHSEEMTLTLYWEERGNRELSGGNSSPMAEILIPEQNHHQQLFQEQELFEPSASSTPLVISDAAFSPFLRGPMYLAYAELREWKLRLKKAGLSPSCPIPVQVNRHDASAPFEDRSVPEILTDFSKENRKPKTPVAQRCSPWKAPPVAQMFDSLKTPPAALKPEMRRVGSMSAGKGEVKRGGPLLGGSDRVDEFLLTRSFSSYQESVSRNQEDGRRGRAANTGIFRKTFTGLRRSTAKATSWIG